MSEEKVHFALRAEYVCGHPPKIICQGELGEEHFVSDVTRMVMKEKDGDGNIDFRCPCGEWASFIEYVVDGKTVSRMTARKVRSDLLEMEREG